MASAQARSSAPRSAAGRAAHAWPARSAAAMAASVSPAPISGVLPTTLPSAGLMTGNAAPLAAAIQRPSTYPRSRSRASSSSIAGAV